MPTKPVLPIGVSRHFWSRDISGLFSILTSPNKLQFRLQINQKNIRTKQKEYKPESPQVKNFMRISRKGRMPIRQKLAMRVLRHVNQDKE